MLGIHLAHGGANQALAACSPPCPPACPPAPLLTILSNVGLECSSQNWSGSPSWALKVSCCPAARPHSTWKERQQVPKEHWLHAA